MTKVCASSPRRQGCLKSMGKSVASYLNFAVLLYSVDDPRAVDEEADVAVEERLLGGVVGLLGVGDAQGVQVADQTECRLAGLRECQCSPSRRR